MNNNINADIIEPAFNVILEMSNPESDLHFELEALKRMQGLRVVQKRGIKVVESFPWPIGKELSTLFSSSYNVRDQNRLIKVFRVTERITQFLSFCWLIQLWDAKRNQADLALSADFQTQFKNFGKPSIGTHLGLIRSCSNILFDVGVPLFFKDEDLKKRIKDLVKEIEKLTVFRNKEMHFKEEIFCEDAEEILANVISKAAFLINYPMMSVKEINVFKTKLDDPQYRHSIVHLNSHSAEFSGEYIERQQFAESYSVLLVENTHSIGSYLNLSPLIINTEPFLASRGRSKVLQGLYMYQDQQGSSVNYAFVNDSETHTLSDMPESSIFQQQWDNFMQTLS